MRFFVFLTSCLVSLATHANGILDRAYEQYSLRDFTPTGIKNVVSAQYNYDRMKNRLGGIPGEYARVRSLQAMVFIAIADPQQRKFYVDQGFGEANSAYLSFKSKYGQNPLSNNSLGEYEKKVYADLLYWGARISEEWIKNQGGSLTFERKKLINNMEQLINAGWGCLNHGGAFSFLGRLEEAYTCAPWNGEVVLRLAQEYKQKGQPEKAIALLKKFLEKKPTDLSLDLIPENTRDQKKAISLLQDWGAIQRPQAVPGEYIVELHQPLQLQFKNTFSLGEVKTWISPKVFVLKRTPLETDSAVITSVLQSRSVKRIEPNYIYQHFGVSDPLFHLQWAVQNIGQADPLGQVGYPGVDIQLPDAWKITTGDSRITVAVIDTGLDIHHPDLQGNIWTNPLEAEGKPGVDDDSNGFVDDIHGWDFVKNQPLTGDEEGHGTHCAGIIGAVGNNGIGVAGVNWNVKLMGIRFLDSRGGGSLDLALKAVQYATLMKVHIMSNSWGGGGYSEILKNAIQEANNQGILFVAAAGNNGENTDVMPSYPSSYPMENILSVAAISNQGRLAHFSNFGEETVDIAAPGQNIMSTLPQGRYESFSGTSMATPYVAGAAALVLSRENLTAKDLKNRLLKTITPLNQLKGKVNSSGYLNTLAALKNTTQTDDSYDPSRWNKTQESISTPHPYPANTQREIEFHQPGAQFMAVRFSKLDIEKNYDRIFFLDSQKRIIASWTGAHNEEYSPIIAGDRLYIRFNSDSFIQNYGFDIDQLVFK